MLVNLFHGFCMALADSVPGVSGGTIAFILGFYDRFLNALHDLFSGTAAERKAALCYLVKLGLGWVVGMGLAATALAQVFESGVYVLSSAFLGLTIASLPFIIREERSTLAGRGHYLVFTLIGIAVVVRLRALRGAGFGGTLSLLDLQLWQYPYLFLVGALAITAMVLPGISGSTLLLVFGAYMPVISALHELMRFHLAVLPGLIVFGCGVLCGIALSIHFIRRALQQYRPQTVYLIIGLMLGSLYAIVMGPATLAVPQAPLSLSTFSIPGFLIGIAVLGGLEAMRHMIERKTAQNADKPLPAAKNKPRGVPLPGPAGEKKRGRGYSFSVPPPSLFGYPAFRPFMNERQRYSAPSLFASSRRMRLLMYGRLPESTSS